jgi:hypothetical protein
MPTTLDMLLEAIDPSRTFDQVSARVDGAVNSFAMNQAAIEDWDEYESLLSEFHRHVQTAVLRIGPGAPEGREFHWSRCVNLLKEKFGPNGYKAGFEMARTGNEGGLYRVLKTIGELMADEYAQNEISARIWDYWEGLKLDEQLAAADEYLGKYGHLLPAELTEGNATRLQATFPKVLEEHPKIVRRMRRIGR